jgi:hypothetical protein
VHCPLPDRNPGGWRHLVDLHSVWSLKLELRDQSLLPVWCDTMRKNKLVKMWNEILKITYKVTYYFYINWRYAENKDNSSEHVRALEIYRLLRSQQNANNSTVFYLKFLKPQIINVRTNINVKWKIQVIMIK